MNRNEALDAPADRQWFVDQVARGASVADAAEALGTSMRNIQRYANDDSAFRDKYTEAKRKGRSARRSATGEVRLRMPPPTLAAESVAVARGEQALATVFSGGLHLNAHLPPLSIESHLGECQRIMYDKKEPVVLRKEAMRQIGAHTLLPAMRPPPPRNETGTVAEAQQPALAIPGSGRVVVLVAPDNGMYAPGCGPGQATVVDEAESAEAELVTAG